MTDPVTRKLVEDYKRDPRAHWAPEVRAAWDAYDALKRAHDLKYGGTK